MESKFIINSTRYCSNYFPSLYIPGQTRHEKPGGKICCQNIWR